MKTLIPILLFIFICLCGWFIAWIGGIQPFTDAAGWIAGSVCFIASYVSAMVYCHS